MEFYFRYLGALLIVTAAVYATGWLVEKLTGSCSSGFYTSLFNRLLGGLAILVALVSLVLTKGHSVNLFILVVFSGMIALRFTKVRPADQQRNAGGISSRIKDWLPFSIVLLLLFSLKFYGIYNPSGTWFLPNPDTLFHANVSNFIWDSGTESISLDYFKILPLHPEPYHYFDLWFNAGAFHLFGLPALSCYILLTIPLLAATVWVGFMALAGHFRQTGLHLHLLSFSFLFFSGTYLPLYEQIPLLTHANVFAVDLFNYNKLLVVMLFSQAGMLFFLKDKVTEGSWMLLLLPVVFISTAASIPAALAVFIVFQFAREKNMESLLQQACMLLALVIFMFFFYRPGPEAQTIRIREVQGGVFSLFTPAYLKTAVNIFGLTGIHLILIYLPVLLVLIPGFRFLKPYLNPFRNRWVLLARLLFIISLSAWAALHYMVDTVQLFSNISVVMLGLFFFLTVLFLLGKVSGIYRALLFLICFAMAAWKINYFFSVARTPWPQSEAYLQQTAAALQETNPKGVFMFSPAEYRKVFDKNPIFNIAGRHLAYSNSKAYSYSISVYDTPVSDNQADTDRQLMGRSAFYRYTEKMKADGAFKSIPETQMAFIRQNGIGFLIAGPGAEPDSAVSGLFANSVTDSATGERFYWNLKDWPGHE